ncbi:MAG: hypothetical protein IKO99_16000 [Bacteroidales bacterium]|nr:hypothetical protein [Bacteroidales bacterium]
MDLYFFNPACELEVANGDKNYSLQKFPQMLENDLRTLPLAFAKNDGYVLTLKPVQGDRFVSLQQAENMEFDNFFPWGPSQRAFNIVSNVRIKNRPKIENFKKFYSRQNTVDFLSMFPAGGKFPGKNELPFIAKTADEAFEFFREKFSLNYKGVVFKAPFAASGRGVRIFKKNELTDNIAQWTNFVIKTQGFVECEVYFEKLTDFSMHYTFLHGGIEFRGLSVFKTADNGFYQSSYVKNFSEIPGVDFLFVSELKEMQTEVLKKMVFMENYSGCLGIDCMVYNDNGEKKINPCVEINCRNSMGRLALELSDKIKENSSAEFFVFQNNKPPLGINEKPVFENGKLKSGFWRLSEEFTEKFSAGILATSQKFL